MTMLHTVDETDTTTIVPRPRQDDDLRPLPLPLIEDGVEGVID